MGRGVLRHGHTEQQEQLPLGTGQTSFGCISNPYLESLIYISEPKTLASGQADHVQIYLEPRPAPGTYFFDASALTACSPEPSPENPEPETIALGVCGIFDVGDNSTDPLYARIFNLGDADLTLPTGQLAGVAVPQGDGISTGFKILSDKFFLDNWDTLDFGADPASLCPISQAIGDGSYDKDDAISFPKHPGVEDGTLVGPELEAAKRRAILETCTQFDVTPNLCFSDMPDNKRQLFIAMVRARAAAFTPSKEQVGKTDLIKLKLNTGDHAPIALPPRRLAYAHDKFVFEQIQSWLKNLIIRPAAAPGPRPSSSCRTTASTGWSSTTAS